MGFEVGCGLDERAAAVGREVAGGGNGNMGYAASGTWDLGRQPQGNVRSLVRRSLREWGMSSLDGRGGRTADGEVRQLQCFSAALEG